MRTPLATLVRKFILNPQFSILNPLFLLLAACGPGAEAPNGRELYLAYGCAACHGENGDGNGPSAGLSFVKPRDLRNLAAYSGPKSAEGIAGTIAIGIASGRTGMPGYPDIPQRERLAIAEHLLSLAAAPRGVTADAVWVAESNPAWKIAAAYASLANPTANKVSLVSASTPAARTVEMHEMTSAEGMMSMRQVERIDVPPNGTTRLEPGGTHLMLIDLTRDLRAGDAVVLTLQFDDGSVRTVSAPVRAMTVTAATTGAVTIPPQTTGEYTLLDHDRRPFHSSSLRGQPAILFFGYTHCPDACPMTMAKLARAYRLVGPDAQKIPTLFVSVDPRDTPEVLRRYLSYFGATPAKGLTGSQAQIDAVVQQFGARYEIHGSRVDHTLSIYLIDRKGRVAKKFDPATADPREIAKAMREL
ncbi:MAG TPA: SCO family protein [Thermoanaerobaculia bacterium]|nr:SCO family protein [Thermoanaerobaculia bacterium]